MWKMFPKENGHILRHRLKSEDILVYCHELVLEVMDQNQLALLKLQWRPALTL